MNNLDYLSDLQDRIAKIQAIDAQYNLRQNAYISFSGGLDSCVLSHLIDLALPNNNIPRLFINTGLEYNLMLKFVRNQMKQDSRIIEIKAGVNIPKMIKKVGYPFKSKKHSHYISIYQHRGLEKSMSVKAYLHLDYTKDGKISFDKCPKDFEYNFTPEFKLKCSDRCCQKLKKEPAHKWAVLNNKSITLTGIRAEEGGSRAVISCTAFKGEQLYKFHPLLVIKEEWEWDFINIEKIEICKLYYPPYNFKRTGCKGCPFAYHLKEELEKVSQFLPAERKQCEYLWGPVYEEYRRIGYRLDKEGGKDNG